MLRNLAGSVAIAVLLLSATAALDASVHGKGTWRVAGTAMVFCPATVPPNESSGNGEGRKIGHQTTGMAARAFIAGAGPGVASARAEPRRRSAMSGTAVDNGPRQTSLADLDASYSPAIGRPHAPPNQIANAGVIVVTAIAVRIVIAIGIVCAIAKTQA